VVEIWCAAVDATHHFLAPQDRAAIEQEVRAVLPAADLWLAVDAADRPLGFMGLSGAHVDALFVDPAHHGAGLGRALMQHAIAATGGDVTVDVNAENPQAVGFYERLGFVIEGRSPKDGQGRAYPLLHMRRPRASAPART
jgi:putative acetyltransferase